MTDIHILEEIPDLEHVCSLFGKVWPSPDGHPPTTVGLLKALTYTDNYVSGAFREGRMIGAAVAFLGYRAGHVTLFSNQIAVEPEVGGEGVGLALQKHMRDWAIAHDIDEINWTFDPAIVRNAYFFIHKVGAHGIAYLPDFYGGSYDPGDDASDRIFAVWDLRHTGDGDASTKEPPLALFASLTGEPVFDTRARRQNRFGIQFPKGLKSLRSAHPALADRWRREVRHVLGSALGDGYRLVDVSREGRYVIAR